MSKYDDPSEGLIPLKDFLTRLNLTLKEYLSLNTVPFPIVLSDGNVIYFKYKETFILDRNNTDVFSKERIFLEGTLEQFYNSEEVFVDVRGFIPETSIDFFDIDDLIYRHSELDLDRLKPKRGSACFFLSETVVDTNQISHEIGSGKEYLLYSDLISIFDPSYNFSSFDLINQIDTEFFVNYRNPDCSITCNQNTGKFDYILNINVQQSEIIMTQSNQPTAASAPRAKKTSSVVEANKVAIIAATKLEVGGLALDLITDQIAKGIPEGFRPFIVGNPLFKIAVANAVNLLVLQTNIDDPKLLILNDAMMTKSYSSMLESFDLTSLLSTVLTQIPAGKLKTLSENE